MSGSLAPATTHNFREDDTPAMPTGTVAIASAKTRITPRETLTFQLRNTNDNVPDGPRCTLARDGALR